MRIGMRCGALTIPAALASFWLATTPAAAQYRYYYGYPAQQSQPDYSAYPAFPGEEQTRPGYGYAPSYDPNYGEPQSLPPGQAQPGVQYGRPPVGNTPSTDQGFYNPPPDDAAAAATVRTAREVDYPSTEPPGTLIVDTNSKHLYYIQSGGKAIQYGIGVGREGFAWSGVARVGAKQQWPKWFPPEAMLQRRPDLPIEMDGGLGNPLGARALYLYQGKTDTQYRIHGTNEPDTIGKAVSSGCIRMMNADVMDLYNRVPIGAKVIVE
ncbi:MAG: L,D-transpeptidase [Methylovirgula sp.]